MLTHYFEPFNIQNNRLLLHTAQTKLSETGKWQWRFGMVVDGLDRLSDILQRLSPALKNELVDKLSEMNLGTVQVMKASGNIAPLLELTYFQDFRLPVLKPLGAPAWVKQHFVVTREDLPRRPDHAAVVLSYALGGMSLETGNMDKEGKDALEKQRRQVLRQFMTYSPDIICVQQCEGDLTYTANASTVCDPTSNLALTDMPHSIRDDRKFFSMLREHLEAEGFEWCAGPAQPLGGTLQPIGYVNVNAVFWRRSAWEAAAWTTGVGGSVVASLRPREGPAWSLSVVLHGVLGWNRSRRAA